jgi:hypothetical protein
MFPSYAKPMKRETQKTVRPKRKSTRFPGIVEHARTLRVSRVHLYLVLTGRRESRSLLRRYAALGKEAA